jgi:hypothetical protein
MDEGISRQIMGEEDKLLEDFHSEVGQGEPESALEVCHEDDVLAGMHVGLDFTGRKPTLHSVWNPVALAQPPDLVLGHIGPVPARPLRGVLFHGGGGSD